MKPKTLIVLLAALAACVVFIVLKHSYRALVGEKPAALPVTAAVFDPAPDGATALTVTSADGSRLAFAQAEGVWRMTAPVEARADAARVEQLLGALLAPQAQPVSDDDARKTAITGLDAPRWRLELTDRRGATHRLAVGRAALMTGGERTYVRNEATGKVFIVAFDFAGKLSRPAGAYRDKRLWDLRAEVIQRVAIAGRHSYQLVRDDGAWKVIAPGVLTPADAERAEQLVEDLAEVTIRQLVADAPESLGIYGLDNPRLTVMVEVPAAAPPATAPASGPAMQTRTLIVGAMTDEGVYAKLADAPSVFQIAAMTAEALQPPLDEIRDRRVLPDLADATVIAMDLQVGDAQATLVRGEGEWFMELPYAGQANWAAVHILLEELRGLRAEDFHDGRGQEAAFGLTEPRGVLTLHLAGWDRPLQLLVGAESASGEMAYCRLAEGNTVFVVRAETAKELLQPAATYWHTALLEIPADETAAALEIRQEGKLTALAVDEGGAWRMSKPIEAVGNAEAVGDLVALLRALTARRIVSLDRRVPATYAKAKGVATVTLTTTAALPVAATSVPDASTAPPQSVEQVYTVQTVTLDGEVYAWVGEQQDPAVVGLMDATLPSRLGAEFRSRRVGPPPGQVEGFTVTIEGIAWAFWRQVDQWRCRKDPDVPLSGAKIDAFLQNVRLLRAERFVVYHGGVKDSGLDSPALTVEVTPAAGEPYKVAVSASGPEGSPHRYATSTTAEGVFLLSGEAIEGLSKTMDDFRP